MKFKILFAVLAVAFTASAVMAQPKLGGPYPHYLIAKDDSSYVRTFQLPDSATDITSAVIDVIPGSVVYSAMRIDFTDDSVDTKVITQCGFDGLVWVSIDSVNITAAGTVSSRKHRTDTLACNQVRWLMQPIDAPFKADTGVALGINFVGHVIVVKP